MSPVMSGYGKHPSADLIVNADDYGYSKGVSQGILEAIAKGVVTATGILANSPFFEEHVSGLLGAGSVDAGVHLNLTAGCLLTGALRKTMGKSEGVDPPDKFRVAFGILSGRIDVALIEAEWDAQIRRCRDAGVHVRFLNSHEHLHMLPPLFRLIHQLADRYSIPYIRYSSAEWFQFPNASGLTRELTLQLLDWVNRGNARRRGPRLLGVSRSGKLDLTYLERRLAALRVGTTYELMCHPGHFVADEFPDRRLVAYHDWEGELDTLLRAKARGLFQTGNVRLIGFRDLDRTMHSHGVSVLEAMKEPCER